MQISVSGKQLDVGASLREYVENTLDAAVNKYFEQAIDADVVFSKEAHLFCADIVVNEGTGTNVIIKGQAKADDIYASFDQAADRIEKQLRRYKRRLKNHHHKALAELSSEGKKYIISDDSEKENNGDNPLIIAEKPAKIEALSVSDAVMRMNLANLPALMFINQKTQCIDVVYRRQDGNISWVDSGLKAGASKKNAA